MSLDIFSRLSSFTEILKGSVVTDDTFSNTSTLDEGLTTVCKKLLAVKNANGNIYIIGNGGSAAVASHAATDLFNVAKLKASVISDNALMTCMANDYGYENALSRILAQLLNPGDLLIAIRSSGNSLNVINAVKIAKNSNAFIVTLTGFSEENPVRKIGDINIWLNSKDYGYVEIGHQFLLHNMADRFNTKLEGPYSD